MQQFIKGGFPNVGYLRKRTTGFAPSSGWRSNNATDAISNLMGEPCDRLSAGRLLTAASNDKAYVQLEARM
jgi:hypothetical protein